MKNLLKNIYYGGLFGSIAIFLIAVSIFIFELKTFNFILYLLIYIIFFLSGFYVGKKYVKKNFSGILTNIMFCFNLIALFLGVCGYSYFIFFWEIDLYFFVFYILYTLGFVLFPVYHIFILSMMILYFIKSIFFKQYKEEGFDGLFFYAFYHSLAGFFFTWLYSIF